MSGPLDAEIILALDRLGWRALSWRRISTIRAAEHARSVFAVELEGSRIIKARRLEDAASASRLVEIRDGAPAGFAPVIERCEAVLFEPWIEGDDLAHVPPTTAHLSEAAALLARLHGTRTALGCPLPVAESTAREREAAERARHRLAADGHLRQTENDEIGSSLARLDPGRALAGVVHTDFCGENMVIDQRGRLHVIDNERMGIGPLGLDVARTWYRWALPPEAWEHFRCDYRGWMPQDDALPHLAFWAIVATLKSAVLRLQLEPQRAHLPIARLRQAMADIDGFAP